MADQFMNRKEGDPLARSAFRLDVPFVAGRLAKALDRSNHDITGAGGSSVERPEQAAQGL